MYNCPKCEGHGTIGAYKHVQGGVCFKCGGHGKLKGTAPKPSTKWIGVIDGKPFGGWVSAKTEAAALKKVHGKWMCYADAPCYKGVTSADQISVMEE